MFTEKKKDTRSNLLLSVILFTLTMAKEAGLAFAVFIAAAWILQEFPGKQGWNKKGALRWLGTVALAVLSIVLPKVVWKIALQARNVPVSFSQPIDFQVIWALITGADTGWHLTAVKTFADAFWNNPQELGSAGITLTYPLILLLFAIILFLFYILNNRKKSTNPEEQIPAKRNQRIALIILILQTVFYAVGQAFVYLFKFGEGGSIALVSFDRYLRIPFLATLVAILLIAMHFFSEVMKGKKTMFCLVLVPVMLLLLPLEQTGDLITRKSARDSTALRAPYNELARQVHKDCGDRQAKVYIISQRDSGWQYYMLRYCLQPCLSTGWVIHPDGDRYEGVSIYTAEEWREKLKDYVILYGMDDIFREEYSGLFLLEEKEEIPDGRVYRVDHSIEMLIELK